MSVSAVPIVFVGSRLLLRWEGGGFRLPSREEVFNDIGAAMLAAAAVPVVRGGEAQVGIDSSVFALGEDFVAPAGYRLAGLRDAFFELDAEEFRLAGAARQRIEWHRTHQFCSVCGTSTQPHVRIEAMACPACGHLHFARVTPAVIVLVQRGQEALLGRSPHFSTGVYSTLAGFVEPGETLEECVHREVEEEVGVQLGDLKYFASQPHPFPNSLMVGFVADWASGDIRVDPTEIEDARWFHRESLPELPHPMSIARALIEDFLRRTEPT